MRFRRRIRKSTKQYIIVAFICIFVIGGAAAFTSIIIANQIRDDYELLLRSAYNDMEINKKNLYVATKDILPGELIAIDMLEKRLEYSSQPTSVFITENDIGKVALVPILTGTQILNTMLTDNSVASNLREMEYNVIHISSNIVLNDTVDIRIFFPNGENYVVLAKKEIKGLLMDTAGVFLWLEEEELLRMSAAIVDAALYQGAKLYVTKYIEPKLQDASIVTYVPSLSILSLLENNPNIVEQCSQKLNMELRKAMENRLAAGMNIDITNIHWDTDLNNYLFSKDAEPAAPDVIESEGTSSELTDNVLDGTVENGTVENEVVESGIIKSGGVEKEEAAQVTKDKDNSEGSELGKTDYFYYVQETAPEEGVIEYGE